jgi:hypothetical protein
MQWQEERFFQNGPRTEAADDGDQTPPGPSEFILDLSRHPEVGPVLPAGCRMPDLRAHDPVSQWAKFPHNFRGQIRI